MDKLKLITKFPYLIEYEPDKYIGILHLKTESIGIQFICPNFPRTGNMDLKITRHNQSTNYNVEDQVHIIDLLTGLEEGFRTAPTTSHREDISSLKAVLDQLAALGNEYRFELSDDHKTIHFPEIPNFAGHYLAVVHDNLKKNFQLKRHSLPEKCNFTLKGKTLSDLLNQFQSELNNLEEFYGNLSDIDELCFVIAPVPVTTKDCYRIFKFNEKVFLKVTLDPFVPSNVQLNFIGPLEEVEPLRRTYCEKIDDWDVDSNVHKNLLRMFDLLYFPYRPDCNPNLADNRSCSICFEFNLDNTYPIITCFNANCEVIFHVICLRKWFETLSDTKTFCTVTSGLCPYCKQKLTMYIDICEDQEGYSVN